MRRKDRELWAGGIGKGFAGGKESDGGEGWHKSRSVREHLAKEDRSFVRESSGV